MTASDWNKILRMLKAKPVIAKRFLKYSRPKERTTGIAKQKCKRCGRFGAHLNQYNIHLCRQCFREIAEKIGFKKYQ